jgi:hypothetical protein
LRGICGTTEQLAEKVVEGAKKHTSGAKARTHFQRLNGTSQLVPFPFDEKSEFFRKL